MMKKIAWYIYGIEYVLRKKGYLKAHKYADREELTCEQANKWLLNKIQSNEPFFAGRIGFFEMAAMRAFEFDNTNNYPVTINNIYNCAGFFPEDINLGNRFNDVMKKSLSNIDFLGYSGELAENYFINTCTPRELTISRTFDSLQPWRYEQPWSQALKGKKVLVVHPFRDTIEMQYKKRELLFKGTDILPEFTLLTYRAIQTVGDLKDERFDTWFDALDYMTEEILKMDFDIALLGCGAYGFPLASRIKEAGKQAIHMGGTSQLLFGIMGKRWDGTGPNSETKLVAEEIRPYYNENWSYPLESDTPNSTQTNKVEYGPYWK